MGLAADQQEGGAAGKGQGAAHGRDEDGVALPETEFPPGRADRNGRAASRGTVRSSTSRTSGRGGLASRGTVRSSASSTGNRGGRAFAQDSFAFGAKQHAV